MGDLGLIETINSIAVLILAALIAWARYREKKLTEKYRLGPNPERCASHEERLNSVELQISYLSQECRRLTDNLGDIKERLARIEAKINGHG